MSSPKKLLIDKQKYLKAKKGLTASQGGLNVYELKMALFEEYKNEKILNMTRKELNMYENKQKLSPEQLKYCSCVVKVSNNNKKQNKKKYVNPYAICHASVKNVKGKFKCSPKNT